MGFPYAFPFQLGYPATPVGDAPEVPTHLVRIGSEQRTVIVDEGRFSVMRNA